MTAGFQLEAGQAEGYEQHTAAFMAPSARLLVDAAALGADDSVLDLACGTGLIARSVAAVVSPGGMVAGVDVNPTMLAMARALGGSAIEWVESSADELPFDDATFTAVLCQQGFQFFADPVRCAAEARRVLADGGLLSATVWATPNRCPYIETQLELLAALEPKVAASAKAATPLEAGRLLGDIAAAAGFADIEVSILEHHVDIPDMASFFLAQTATTPWAAVTGALSANERRDASTGFVAQLAAYAADGGGHRVPFRSHHLVARNHQ